MAWGYASGSCLNLSAGSCTPVPTPVQLPGLAHQLVAGRPITVQAPDIEVLLDTILIALILGQSVASPPPLEECTDNDRS